MLWQHGLEKPVAHRTAIAAALLLLAAAFITVPGSTTRWDAMAPVAASVVGSKPATDAGTLTLPLSQRERETSGVSQRETGAVPAPAASDAGIANALIQSASQGERAQSDQQPPAGVTPPLDPLPQWVQSTRDIALWSDSGEEATQLSTLPEGSYLQVLGQPANGCLPVRLEGENAIGRVGGWVNAGDVRPADSPVRVVASSRGGLRSTSTDLSTRSGFISVIAQAAQQSQQATGVPAAVTIAQAILESDWGKSLLATEASNFFGIKALNGPGPAGVVNMDTWEVMNGSDTVVNAAFKAYHNVFESVDDHGNFLRDNPRYSTAFQADRDPREFARRINTAGYATDPAYSTKLIGLMDKYNLYRYDLPIP